MQVDNGCSLNLACRIIIMKSVCSCVIGQIVIVTTLYGRQSGPRLVLHGQTLVCSHLKNILSIHTFSSKLVTFLPNLRVLTSLTHSLSLLNVCNSPVKIEGFADTAPSNTSGFYNCTIRT